MPDFVSDQFKQQFADVVDRLGRAERKLDSINGPGVVNDADSIAIYPPPAEPATPFPQDASPPPKAQYEGEVEQAAADGTMGASYFHGYMMNPTT